MADAGNSNGVSELRCGMMTTLQVKVTRHRQDKQNETTKSDQHLLMYQGK